MAIENGKWIMRGMNWDDPSRIQTWKELIDQVDELGFLPLFKNEVNGFSAEENTSDLYWWTGDEERDPWEWRRLRGCEHCGRLCQLGAGLGIYHLPPLRKAHEVSGPDPVGYGV